jgi:uncharacterized protein (DUF58 family)
MAVPAHDDKFGLALLLAAALAYVGMSENDSVRLGAFRAGHQTPHLQLTPFHRRRESFFAFQPFVTGLKSEGQTRLGAAVSEFLSAPHRPGIVIVISDFLVNPVDYESALIQLVGTRHELKIIHVLGDQEYAGGYPPGAYRVRDCETGEIREVTFSPHEGEACRRRVEQHADRLNAFCRSRGIVYAQAFGASNVEEIIRREFPRLGVIA